jgi:hypothetical protein
VLSGRYGALVQWWLARENYRTHENNQLRWHNTNFPLYVSQPEMNTKIRGDSPASKRFSYRIWPKYSVMTVKMTLYLCKKKKFTELKLLENWVVWQQFINMWHSHFETLSDTGWILTKFILQTSCSWARIQKYSSEAASDELWRPVESTIKKLNM